MLIAALRKNANPKVLISSMLFAISIYYSLASIVHPWYIAIPLFFSVFTRYKFPLVWSFFTILSYAAYQNDIYRENLYLVAIEYMVVYSVLVFELLVLEKTKKQFLKRYSFF
jgi:hypothetical protein